MWHSGQFLYLVAAATAVTAKPGEGLYAGGGLTILTRNDLDGAPNDGSAAILISQPSAFDAGYAACKLLNEVPWSPETGNFKTALSNALAYQDYQGLASKDHLYWISKAKACDATCRAIDADGNTHQAECGTKLPTLCTQSAPLSSSSSNNASVEWQVQQTVGSKVLTGYRDYHVWKFRGIRYAETPARFTYSQVASFDEAGVVNATTAGADCSQPIGEVTSGSSEDCLFANVWTPFLPPAGEVDKAKLKPVMLYLYGGGWTSGSGKNPNTDGTNLASRGDVVVVSVNYRVGSIGFLNFNDGVHDGNYGISDMVTALQWLNKYIKYLGGDPDNVTVFGESAGAGSTRILLGVAKAKGLFHRAALQSSPDGYPGNGQPTSQPYYADLDMNYLSTTAVVLKQAGCANATDSADAITCLSKLSGFELVSLPTNANGVVMDGTYLTDHELIVNSTAASIATNVTVLVGGNRDEFGILLPSTAYPVPNNTNFTTYLNTEADAVLGTPADIAAILGLTSRTPSNPFPGLPPALFNTTSPADPSQIFNATIRLATDWLFTCQNLAMAYSAAKHSAFAATYYFQFNRTYSPAGYTTPWCSAPADDAHPHGNPDAEYFKCHGGEQIIVFGTEARTGSSPDRDGFDVPFMQLVVDYWAAFARKGDPNPERGWLLARGYEGTLREVERVGEWEKVDVQGGKPTMRLLQWGGAQVPLGEGFEEVCGGLGVPLDSLEVS